MKSARIGKLEPRYAFILNPYPDERLSKCPRCHAPTHPRKFALLIDIDEWGPLVLGKTCVYCSVCELIIVHQQELEGELALTFLERAPLIVGNEYTVFGTVEKSFWKSGLGAGSTLGEMLEHAGCGSWGACGYAAASIFG